MPVSYCEIWINDNNTIKFHNKFPSEQALTDAIYNFIHKREKGLHVCIICTDNSIVEQEQLKDIVIDLINKEANLIFLNEDTTEEDWKKSCFYACVEIVSSITELLNKMVTIFGENLSKDTNHVATWIELYSSNKQYSFEKTLIWQNPMNKDSLNNFLTEEERNGNCADIKFVFFLPQQCFEIFTAPNCLFNEFIECIILALSPDGVLRLKYQKLYLENEKRKEYIFQLERKFDELKKVDDEKDKEIDELKRKIDKLKMINVKKDSEIDELKRKIDEPKKVNDGKDKEGR